MPSQIFSEASELKSEFLNVVCFDVPYPADYGGAIEEFYKLKAIHAHGVRIFLHCFVYGDRHPDTELEKYCERIFYYKRKRRLIDVFSGLPFIVKSRMPEELLKNLSDNDFPILFDATHCTGFIDADELKHRKKAVRLHNIEWIYYHILIHSTYSLKEKLFYFLEYKKLKKYDAQLVNAAHLSCLSVSDFEYYKHKLPENKCSLEFVFHENEKLTCKTGKGNYILYQGNLSLTDNYQLIIDVLENELNNCTYPIILAGKNPSESLINYVAQKPSVKLIQNPSSQELDELMENAHICLALAKNPSGVKLKLINSLFKSRFVISDINALNGSDLDDLCIVPATKDEFLETVNTLMKEEFTKDIIEEREKKLMIKYNNLNNARQLLNHIFGV